jgi:hypothetical protein
MEAPRLEVQRPADPHLAIGGWGAKGPLFSSAHPTEAHLGIPLQLGFVLCKNEPASSSVICRMSSSLVACLRSICSSEPFSGPTGRGLLQRYSTACAARGEVSRGSPPASLSLISCRQRSLQLQRSWRAQPAMLDGRVLFEQFLDRLVGLLVEQRHGAAPLALVEGRPSRRKRETSPRRRWCASTRGGGRSRWARVLRRRAA